MSAIGPRRYTWRRRLLLAALALLAGGTAAVFLDGPGTFYDASRAELRGEPGTIIRSEPISAFDGANAWRVLYRSIGVDGKPVAVAGVVVAPASGGANRPVIAWAHPTTGIARKCAPSLGSNVLGTIPGLHDMIKRGFVIAATDYEGLGTVQPHPYLVGVSAARSLLDSVRAARALTGAGSQFALWGHSQGGHAVLWGGKLANQYAPELSHAGTAAAAPPTELATLFEDDLTTAAGQAFSALALLSWSRVFDLKLDTIIHKPALSYVDWIGKECMTNPLDLFIDELAMRGLKKEFLLADPVKTPPWQALIAANTPDDLPVQVPLLIAQGRNDGLILPAVTRDYAARFCKAGGTALLLEMTAGHLDIATLSAPAVVDWMADRFSGKPLAGSCAALQKVSSG